jgi:anti-anti-sigma factor
MKAVERLGPGDHACLVCESDDEHWSVLRRYLRLGLERGERTVYISAHYDDAAVRERLRLDPDLLVLPAAQAQGYADGDFDYMERLDAWEEQARATAAEGFPAMRVAVDMTWVQEVDLSVDDLVDYERRGTELFRDLPATALCIYDRRHFADHTIARTSRAHGASLGRCLAPAPILEAPALTVSAAGPGALALEGELDSSNVELLAGVIETALADDDDLVLDLRELRFINAAGVRILDETAHRLAERGGQLVIACPPPIVRRVLKLLNLDDAITIDEAA